MINVPEYYFYTVHIITHVPSRIINDTGYHRAFYILSIYSLRTRMLEKIDLTLLVPQCMVNNNISKWFNKNVQVATRPWNIYLLWWKGEEEEWKKNFGESEPIYGFGYIRLWVMIHRFDFNSMKNFLFFGCYHLVTTQNRR